VNGIIEWRNPYGYLPAQIAPHLMVYWSIAAALTLLLLIWAGFAIKYRDGLLSLQYAIGLVIFLFAIEQVVWGTGMVVYNETGRINAVISVVGAFFKALKNTSIRCLLLLVGLGVSITNEGPRGFITLLIVIVTSAYLLLDLAYEYVMAAEDAGEPISSKVQFGATAAMFVADAIYWVWIVFATYMTMAELREKGEKFKHKQYMWLVILLLGSLLISLVLVFFEGAMENSVTGDKYWQLWWIWFVYWDCVYFFCVFVVFLLWRPTLNNAQYAYSSQLPQQDDGGNKPSESQSEGGSKEEKNVELEEDGEGRVPGEEEAVELDVRTASSSGELSL